MSDRGKSCDAEEFSGVAQQKCLAHVLRNISEVVESKRGRDDDNQRLLNGIGTQHDRGHLLRFMHREGVEPTNNRAERIPRPAVIARKFLQCSKNQRGANAFAAFMSLAQTAPKKARETVSQAFLSLFSVGTSKTAR